MKIALYYPWLHLTSGIERTILETLKKSEHEYTIFTNHLDIKNTYPDFKNIRIVKLDNISVNRNLFNVLKAAIVISLQKIDLKSFDLLIVHSEGLGDLILLRNNKLPTICYCHTPLRPVFDDIYKAEAISQRKKAAQLFFYIFSILFKTLDRYLWKRYKLIIFNSNESLRRAKQGGLITNNNRYKIINPGVTHPSNERSVTFENFFLLPGRITWTKNIELGIESLKMIKDKLPESKFKLIIAGQLDNKSKKYYYKLLKTSNKNIEFKINQTDKQMANLYDKCYAVLGTALNEDWGITPIEANSHHKPTICINSGGFKESQIDGVTGYLVEPNSDDFSKAMIKLIKNRALVIKMGEDAFRNSLKYSWVNFASKFEKEIKNNIF